MSEHPLARAVRLDGGSTPVLQPLVTGGTFRVRLGIDMPAHDAIAFEAIAAEMDVTSTELVELLFDQLMAGDGCATCPFRPGCPKGGD